MYVDVTDYHGQSVKVDPQRVIKLRPSEVAGDPAGCTLIDFASGGVFAQGGLNSIGNIFAPYIPLASLHAPDGSPVLLNADGIAAILGPDPQYAASGSTAVVATGFENQRVPARNRIPLAETVADAQAALAAAHVEA